jgi:archaellum component FlaC
LERKSLKELLKRIEQEVNFFANDYNNVRTQYEHKIYNPNKFSEYRLEKSYQNRLKENQLTISIIS